MNLSHISFWEIFLDCGIPLCRKIPVHVKKLRMAVWSVGLNATTQVHLHWAGPPGVDISLCCWGLFLPYSHPGLSTAESCARTFINSASNALPGAWDTTDRLNFWLWTHGPAGKADMGSMSWDKRTVIVLYTQLEGETRRDHVSHGMGSLSWVLGQD
jgi:hypothetical protein